MQEQHEHKTIIAIGSNHNQDTNIAKAIGQLADLLTGMKQSEIMQTEPEDGAQGTFKNAMVAGHTRLQLDELTQAVKAMERRCGRNREESERGVIGVDIDIMEYDGQRLHVGDWQRGYINTLLGQIQR